MTLTKTGLKSLLVEAGERVGRGGVKLDNVWVYIRRQQRRRNIRAGIAPVEVLG